MCIIFIACDIPQSYLKYVIRLSLYIWRQMWCYHGEEAPWHNRKQDNLMAVCCNQFYYVHLGFEELLI